MGAIDFGYKGRKYTWKNGRDGKSNIKERLDRVVADKRWMDLYSNAVVEHLRNEESHYMPILVQTELMKKRGI